MDTFDQNDLIKAMCVPEPLDQQASVKTNALGTYKEESPAKQAKLDSQAKCRAMKKVWISVAKLLESQLDKGRCVDLPLAGKFLQKDGVIQYMPALDLVGSGYFKFPENEQNVSPFSKEAKRFQGAQILSLTAIAASCLLDRDTCGTILKQIFIRFIECGRFGQLCSLDFKVGRLTAYPNGTLRFSELIESTDDMLAIREVMHGAKRFERPKSILESTVPSTVRTPFSNLGKASVYRGHNRTVTRWYHKERSDNYSMFSKRTLTKPPPSQKDQLSETL